MCIKPLRVVSYESSLVILNTAKIVAKLLLSAFPYEDSLTSGTVHSTGSGLVFHFSIQLVTVTAAMSTAFTAGIDVYRIVHTFGACSVCHYHNRLVNVLTTFAVQTVTAETTHGTSRSVVSTGITDARISLSTFVRFVLTSLHIKENKLVNRVLFLCRPVIAYMEIFRETSLTVVTFTMPTIVCVQGVFIGRPVQYHFTL